MSEKSVFSILNAIDFNGKIETKDKANYVSWANSWEAVKKLYPDATYSVIKNEAMMPYFADESGAIVYTNVTINGLTHEMWLPVMDSKNKTMKKEAYSYTTKYGDKQVEAYTMFDINKTIMRCLAKNLAMFGCALYIFSKETFNDDVTLDDFQQEELLQLIEKTGSDKSKLLQFFKVKSLDEVPFDSCKAMLLKKIKE